MKAFITKYALTEGIVEANDAEVSKNHPSMITVGASGYTSFYHGEGGDWHRTIDGARRRAEEMRVKKIASLQKSIAKMTNLKF